MLQKETVVITQSSHRKSPKNKERRENLKDPKEKVKRQQELEENKRRRGEGGRGDGTKPDL